MTKRRHPYSLTGSADPPPPTKNTEGERPRLDQPKQEFNWKKTCTEFDLTNQSKREEEIYMGCIGLYTSWRESMVKVGVQGKGIQYAIG